jgi:hypothetical protein
MPDAPSTAPAPKGDVKVPGVGNVDRKWVFAGLAASAGIVVYAYWRRSQAPAESPVEGDQYATGDEYTPDAYIGATAPGGETYDPNAIETNIPTTNQEWSQRAIDALESVGYTRDKAATTIGKYLAGQPLDLAEKLIIQVAIAMMGNPPAGALPIISAPSTPTAPTPTSNKLATPVLRMGVGDPRNTFYQLTWTKVPGATIYGLKRELPSSMVTGIMLPGTSRRVGPLRRGYEYQYRVQAHAPGKLPSNWSNPVRWKVPR